MLLAAGFSTIFYIFYYLAEGSASLDKIEIPHYVNILIHAIIGYILTTIIINVTHSYEFKKNTATHVDFSEDDLPDLPAFLKARLNIFSDFFFSTLIVFAITKWLFPTLGFSEVLIDEQHIYGSFLNGMTYIVVFFTMSHFIREPLIKRKTSLSQEEKLHALFLKSVGDVVLALSIAFVYGLMYGFFSGAAILVGSMITLSVFTKYRFILTFNEKSVL